MGVSAGYYSQTQSWSLTSLAASIIVGITTTLILFCSHFHQVKDDLAAGKLSPIVRLGTERGSQILNLATGSIYAFILIFIVCGIFPYWALLSCFSLPFAFKLCNHVAQNHNQPLKVSNSKFIAIAVQFWCCLLLGIGFVL